MSETVGDFIVRRLTEWGVRRIFGYPGDGINGILDRPERVAGAWEEAFAARRPVVFEAVTDPEVPILPPHLTLAQAKGFATAVLGGDSGTVDMVKAAVKDMAESFLPHGKS